jgi:hypothetical protein
VFARASFLLPRARLFSPARPTHACSFFSRKAGSGSIYQSHLQGHNHRSGRDHHGGGTDR